MIFTAVPTVPHSTAASTIRSSPRRDATRASMGKLIERSYSSQDCTTTGVWGGSAELRVENTHGLRGGGLGAAKPSKPPALNSENGPSCPSGRGQLTVGAKYCSVCVAYITCEPCG